MDRAIGVWPPDCPLRLHHVLHFVLPVAPCAGLGWLVLGAFVWQDCFPVPWPWEFESVCAEKSLVGRRGAARDGDTGVWAPEVEVDSMDEAVLALAGISTEALYT
jgi:hypothetical protein